MNGIGDYALIGDCHSAALVGKDGSIDWACFPRFDSPSVFAKILDEERGGHFSVTTLRSHSSNRSYLDGTNVLVTRFETDTGELEVTDCMPVAPLDPGQPTEVRSCHSILRRLRCTGGKVEAAAEIKPRFEYGLFTPRFRLLGDTTGEIVGGADALWVTSSAPLIGDGEMISGRWELTAGDEIWLETAWAESCVLRGEDQVPSTEELRIRLETTVSFWRAWLERFWYEGEYSEAVRRSALTLKALTYAPTGAVVAAPTTSLPEEVGGMRNWDYRYTWIRDATLTLISLFVLGFTDEADQFKLWLERTGAGRASDLQIMYGIHGERTLPERELAHLAGHRGSIPARVGNGAVKQMQLDAYGQILQAGYLYARAGRPLTRDNWIFISTLADIVCEQWRDPDHGIWEMRDSPRHFVHSKLNCWLALKRAVQLGEILEETSRVEAWGRARDEIRKQLMDHAGSQGWFPQAIGHPVADASTLLVPALGLLPTSHPLVEATIQRVRKELENDGLLFRYVADDGLAGGEGAFLLCSFWLLDCLIHGGHIKEAEDLLQRLLSLANDVGLYAEEVDQATGEALGNFPQAFTHMALVLSCAHLSAAKKGQIPLDGAHDYSELALERLLTAQRSH